MPYKINKASYLKRGSHIAKSGKEDNLFDFAFEIELNEHYEDNYLFRDIEKAVKKAKERKDFRYAGIYGYEWFVEFDSSSDDISSGIDYSGRIRRRSRTTT